jgi:hypothetical protein
MALTLRPTDLERSPAMADLEDWIVLDDGFFFQSAASADGPEAQLSNQRPDTLMQDRSPTPVEIFLLRTAGPYMWVMSDRASARETAAYVRFAPIATQSLHRLNPPLRAITSHRANML